MSPRRITVDTRTVQEPRYAGRRILVPEIPDARAEEAPGRPAEWLARAAARRARPGGRVLHLGTGAGAVTVALGRMRPDLSIVGMESSDTALEKARALAKEARLQRRVRLRKGGQRSLPFPRSRFDLVVSDALLHRLPDPVPSFDDIARVLAPGGRVFLRDLRRPGPSRIQAHIRLHARSLEAAGRLLFADSVRAAFKLAEIREMLAESRLAGCRVRPERQTHFVIEGAPRRPRRGRARRG